MKMRSMKVIILLMFCYGCHSTVNRTVYFVSRNFYNVLHWHPAKPAFAGEKLLYSVEYWSDAKEQPFQMKMQCQNITALSCDLTEETPSVHDVYYLARVTVNGRWHGRTIRLKPIEYTIFGPPILSTYTTVSSLHVTVTLPLGPNGVSIKDIIISSKNGPTKTFILYTLTITSPKWAAQVNKNISSKFVINLKNNQTEYCGHVVYKPTSVWGRPESEKVAFCVTLPGDQRMLLLWSLVSASLLAAIVVISVVCLCIYVKGGKENSMPKSLVTTFDNLHEVLQSPDRNLILSKPVVSTKSDQTLYATIRAEPKVSSIGCGGYSPQDIPCQAWKGSTCYSVKTGGHNPTPNQQDTSAQSSETYSSVAVHVPAEENKDLQQVSIEDRKSSDLPLSSNRESCDKGGTSPKLNLLSAAQLPDLDVCENNSSRLLLHTVRDPNGQLMLPSLTFQLQSSPDGTVSPTNPDRKPLLSDLIDSKEGPSLASLQRLDSSDSGCDDSSVSTPTQFYCNTHYFRTQPVVVDGIFESGYKQNWMPASALGAASKDTCDYRRTNYPRTWTGPKKEDEDTGGEEESRQSLLGGWMVQIQE
ncbi:hypothetical protein PAMA_015449 [Pampus argenteus]